MCFREFHTFEIGLTSKILMQAIPPAIFRTIIPSGSPEAKPLKFCALTVAVA
ncbi:MAG: hypothetical protein NZ653_07320 [Anaerolineae bacterium]|nr:hypothetical protein [Anaerolineae bacterium]